MKSGIALYFAVLIGTIIMTTGLGVSTIFYRELRISKLQFPSLVAFYAADAGIECASYWNFKQKVFDDPASPPSFVNCQGANRTVTSGSGSDSNGPYTDYKFQFNLTSSAGNACAIVRVKRQTVGGVPCAVIVSRGRNISCGGSATVERGIISKDPEWCTITID